MINSLIVKVVVSMRDILVMRIDELKLAGFCFKFVGYLFRQFE